jgi:chemotaxis protein histidine kinase CheA
VYDQIKTQLDTIAELSDEQVAELQADVVSQFEMVEGEDPTPETVDAMTSLADSLDTIRGELSRRESMAAELAAKAAEAVARVKGEASESGEEMAMTEDEPMEEETPMEETPAEETPAEEAPSEPEAEVEVEKEEDEEEEDEAMKASAETSEEAPELVTDAPVEAEASVEEEVAVEATETAAEASEIVEEVAELATEEVAEVATEEVAELAASDEITAEASTNQEDGSELSTEVTSEETAELATEVAEGSEASTEEIIESPIALVEEQEEQAPVTAAAEQPFEAPADRQPVVQVTEAPVAITAGADIPGYTAGSTINDMYEVASAMEKRIHSLRRVNGGDGEQHIVASLTTQYPEGRTLSTDAESNMAKIDAVVGQDALVASGGHAAPFEVKYDIFSAGSTTVRPVRDSLPRFQADRGGIRFVTAPSFAAGTYADAVGVWTAANDSAETPSPSAKTSLTVAAAAENTVSTDAVTLQLQFGNLMTRAYPELIARHNELALVQHAREAEQNLLTKIGAASTAVTTSSLIGFGRDFLVQIRRAATAYRSRHRIDPQTRLKAIVPAWVYDAMAADLALAMPGDGTLSVSQSEINGYLANLNVDLVASLDATVFGAQGAAALLEFPDSFDWFLFAEGTFLFLDGGTLDLGIIRDSSLVGTNDYKMFLETFENVAKVGIESLKITSSISVNGVAAALRDTTGGATAAAIEL